MTYLAHSAKPKRGIPVQSYAEHVGNVVKAAVSNAECAAEHSRKFGNLLRTGVRLAAEFHDLGKLDDFNQEVLRANRGKMLNHVDAGVAHLLDGTPTAPRTTAALTVFAHHIGLPNIAEEAAKGAGMVFRDGEPAPNGTPLRELTDQRLRDYAQRHQHCLSMLPPISVGDIKVPAPPMLLRMALSCLVDAESHSDTAGTTAIRPLIRNRRL